MSGIESISNIADTYKGKLDAVVQSVMSTNNLRSTTKQYLSEIKAIIDIEDNSIEKNDRNSHDQLHLCKYFFEQLLLYKENDNVQEFLIAVANDLEIVRFFPVKSILLLLELATKKRDIKTIKSLFEYKDLHFSGISSESLFDIDHFNDIAINIFKLVSTGKGAYNSRYSDLWQFIKSSPISSQFNADVAAMLLRFAIQEKDYNAIKELLEICNEKIKIVSSHDEHLIIDLFVFVLSQKNGEKNLVSIINNSQAITAAVNESHADLLKLLVTNHHYTAFNALTKKLHYGNVVVNIDLMSSVGDLEFKSAIDFSIANRNTDAINLSFAKLS